jgi:hypothetical protein
MAGALDDRAVGERIAERHTELKNVCTSVNSGERDGACCGEVGVAHGEVDDEARAVREADWHQ